MTKRGITTTQQVIVTVPHDMNPGNPKLTVKSAAYRTEDAGMPFMVKVWPNPGEKHFNLDVVSSSDDIIELCIHDISGRLVSVINVTDRDSFRFGDDLQPGIYMATVRQGAFSRTVRIIKE